MCSSIELMLRTTNAIHLKKVSRIRKKCTMERKCQFYLHLLFPRIRNFISQREILPIFSISSSRKLDIFFHKGKFYRFWKQILMCWAQISYVGDDFILNSFNSFAKGEKSKLSAAFRSKSWVSSTAWEYLPTKKAGSATVPNFKYEGSLLRNEQRVLRKQ